MATIPNERRISVIRVLQDWLEIGDAAKFLNKKNLPKHISAEKAWDLFQLYQIAESLSRNARVIDLGCSGAYPLKLLHAMGFENLTGIDLSISWLDRLAQFKHMWKLRTCKTPYRLKKGDLHHTHFPDQHFDCALCLSVIEHGVDLDAFLAEANRILKPGGLLLITTDYWHEPVPIDPNFKQYKLPWKIFSKNDIADFLKQAARFNLVTCENDEIPPCADRCVIWNDKQYTLICVALKKQTHT